jgi:hypothetical protein
VGGGVGCWFKLFSSSPNAAMMPVSPLLNRLLASGNHYHQRHIPGNRRGAAAPSRSEQWLAQHIIGSSTLTD